MPTDFDPYTDWLSVPAGERPPDHYNLLGVPPSARRADIEQAFERACERLHVYTKGAKGDEANRVLNEVSLAFRTLTNAQARRAYDQSRTADASLAAPPRVLPAPVPHRHSVACQFCEARIPVPESPPPMRVFANDRELRSAAFSISIRETLLTEVTISGRDESWPVPTFDPSISKLGAAVAASIIAAVASLPFWCLASNDPGLGLVVAITSVVAISGLTTLAYHLYRPHFSSTVDVAWSEIVPVLVQSAPSIAISSFLAGLAKASEGQGQPGNRHEALDLAIRTQRAWARAGLVSRGPLVSLYRLALVDRRKKRSRAGDPFELLRELWTLCLEGEFSLNFFDQVTHNGKLLHALSHAELAIARLQFVQLVQEHRFSVQDISFMRRNSRAVNELFSLGAELDENAVARLFALRQLRQMKELSIHSTTAFELAQVRRLTLFDKWPDLILHHQYPEIVFCGRGVFFHGMRFQTVPTLHREGLGEKLRVYLDGKAFTPQELPLMALERLAEFCEFCFGPLAAKSMLQCQRPPSTDRDERLLSKSVQCSRCGTSSAMRIERR